MSRQGNAFRSPASPALSAILALVMDGPEDALTQTSRHRWRAYGIADRDVERACWLAGGGHDECVIGRRMGLSSDTVRVLIRFGEPRLLEGEGIMELEHGVCNGLTRANDKPCKREPVDGYWCPSHGGVREATPLPYHQREPNREREARWTRYSIAA